METGSIGDFKRPDLNSDLTLLTIKTLIKDIRETGFGSTSCSIQNIETFRESMAESPETSIRRPG